MDDFIHGRHRGFEKKCPCLGPAWSSWHMQTEKSGIENLQNNNIKYGDVLFHGIILLFSSEGNISSAWRQSQSCAPYRREGRWHYTWLHSWTPASPRGTMDDFIHGRHRGREIKCPCLVDLVQFEGKAKALGICKCKKSANWNLQKQ
jgi:hypothetical protein